MISKFLKKRAAILATGSALALAAAVGCRKGPNVAVVRAKAKLTAKNGINWLKKTQNKDGTFGDPNDPKAALIKVGLTSLATIALLDQDLDENDPNVKRAVAFLYKQRKTDGSISGNEDTSNYETALTTIALKKTGNKAYDEALKKAQAFLRNLQGGAAGKVDLSNPMYGGFGYSPKGHYDLSNTQFALEALRATELGADDATFKRAVTFIERCQNLKKVNKQPWASNDGGFIYYPGGSNANYPREPKPGVPLRSYGGMTYAGLLSFSYCNVPKDDPRVKAALDWLRLNWRLDQNPGMQPNPHDGQYYYYMVMAKALAAYGDKYFVDSKGRKHHWAAELANKLIELQHPEGYWVNDKSDRWLENNKSLVTAYCMIALNRCRPFLEEN